MNFGTFQDFSKEEAAQWLSRFLSEEADAMTEYAADLARDGVACDFSLSSIPAHAVWVADHTQTIKLGTDPSVPDWIKESEGYASHNFEFDDDSRVLLLRLAYYLGECFVRAFPALSWTVGAWDSAIAGQPVVTGFSHEMEMPVLMVSENVVRRLLRDESSDGGAAIAVESWASGVPHQ